MKPSQGSRVKVETWKGKKRVVQRDRKGKLIATIPYRPDKYQTILERHKRTGSIRLNEQLHFEKSYYTVTRSGKGAPRTGGSGYKAVRAGRIPSAYQAYVTIATPNGRYTATSRAYSTQHPPSAAYEEALENAVALAAFKNGLDYNAAVGMEQIAAERFRIIDRGTVVYRAY